MTVFDLLFIALFLIAAGTLVTAFVLFFRGRRTRALTALGKLAICTAGYITFVYAATALSKPPVLRVGDPACDDDWCIAVAAVRRTPMNAVTRLDVDFRIFSRARRVAQRELAAKDVYIVDADWKRYNPIPSGTEIPLNTLLQAGESKSTGRRFEVPYGAHGLGLMVERGAFPFCVIIGECEAFHKGVVIRLETDDNPGLNKGAGPQERSGTAAGSRLNWNP